MKESHTYIHVSIKISTIEDVKSEFPGFFDYIDDYGNYEDGGWNFIIYLCDQEEWWKQEDALYEFLIENYAVLSSLRNKFQTNMKTALYLNIYDSEDCLIIPPELLGLCAGFGIEFNIYQNQKDNVRG